MNRWEAGWVEGGMDEDGWKNEEMAGWLDRRMDGKHRLLVSTVMSLKLLTDELGIQEAGLG